MSNKNEHFSEGYCLICKEDVELSPFADQHCHDCERAIGIFNSKKRQALKRRQNKDSRNGSLTLEELEDLKRAIPDSISHLESCPANEA